MFWHLISVANNTVKYLQVWGNWPFPLDLIFVSFEKKTISRKNL